MKEVFDKDMSEVNDILNMLYTDCELALNGRWDRDDSGFMDMQSQIEKAGELLGIKIESQMDELEGEE